MLPIGTFEVLEHTRPPLRRWLLDRVRVTYAQRKYVKFTLADGLVEPEAGPGKTGPPGGRGNKWVCRMRTTVFCAWYI
jgi:hypothetical protein